MVNDKKHLVIIGGGFAGLRVFYNLVNNKRFSITLIDRRSISTIKPTISEVAFEGKSLDSSDFNLKTVIEGKNAQFINGSVKEIKAEMNMVRLESGEFIKYDYLVVAAGARKNFGNIEGFSENGFSLCDEQYAPKAWKALDSFNGGIINVGLISNELGENVYDGPLKEGLLMIDYFLKRKGIRNKCILNCFGLDSHLEKRVNYVTKKKVHKLMKKKKINSLERASLSSIGEYGITFKDGGSMQSDLTILVPSYSGQKFLSDSNLCDGRGFLPTDKQMRHLAYDNIFGAGDLNTITEPKLGHIASMQADIVSTVILNEVGFLVPIPDYNPGIFLGMDMTIPGNGVVMSNLTKQGPLKSFIQKVIDTFTSVGSLIITK